MIVYLFMFLKFHSSGLKLSITQRLNNQDFLNDFVVILHFLRLFDNLVLFRDSQV